MWTGRICLLLNRLISVKCLILDNLKRACKKARVIFVAFQPLKTAKCTAINMHYLGAVVLFTKNFIAIPFIVSSRTFAHSRAVTSVLHSILGLELISINQGL